jgi:hypothetical protein
LLKELEGNYLLRMCWIIFHHCDKILDINNLKEERFILAYSFRGFIPMVAWPHRHGQNTMVVGACGSTGCSCHRRQEERGAQGKIQLLRTCSQ